MEKVKEENLGNIFRQVAAYALWKSGRLSESLAMCKRIHDASLAMDSLSWQRTALFLQGLILCDKNSLDDARKVAVDLAVSCRTSLNPRDVMMVELMQGAIALQKGDLSVAIERLKQSRGRLLHEYSWASDMHALYIGKLAEAYEHSGKPDEARREYERITALTEGRFRFGDIYARSFYHLGRIHERQGNTAKAVENYRKFLDLWKEADPGLPEVPDARKRLAALQGN